MIAWLGTGLLGSAFVRSALRRGETVHVWNRSMDKARALQPHGAQVFDSVAKAVRGAERVHVCLSNDAAVDDVLKQARAGLEPNVVIVDHTTTSPDGAAARTKSWASAGHPFLHAPVFMGPKNADESTGMMLASGDRTLFDKLDPALAPMTGKVLYLGPEPGRAAGVKLAGNLFLVSMVAGITDMLALAKAQGIPATDVAELLTAFNPGAGAPGRVRQMLHAQFDHPSWNLAMARKDTQLMMDATKGGATPLRFIPAIAAEMDKWLAQGFAAQDWTVFARDVVK